MSRSGQVALGAAVALSLLAELALPAKEAAHFWEWTTFFAWFGLGGCVAIIVLSKALGKYAIQRPEGYYERVREAEEREGRDGA